MDTLVDGQPNDGWVDRQTDGWMDQGREDEMPEANQEVKGKMDGKDLSSVSLEKALSKASSRTLILSLS